MAALISWVCSAEHGVNERSGRAPIVTIYERAWAYCVGGGTSRHRWEPVEPTPVELVRASRRFSHPAERAGSARAG